VVDWERACWLRIGRQVTMDGDEVKESGPVVVSQQDDRIYRHITLSNGLPVMLIHDAESEKASAAMDVRVGSQCDPEETQGLAHFLEHMLFLGTEQFPDENEYSKYLSAHGGSSNAFTADEDTNFFFDVSHEHFEGALARFSQFFISPLFTQAATGREMNAVDSENSKNQQTDVWRLMQLKKSLARQGHPYRQFGTGNLVTLRDNPEAKGIDLRAHLLEFHAKYYSANVMRLVMLGRDSLDDLQSLAVRYFQGIENKGVSPPLHPSDPFTPAELAKRLDVVPVKEKRSIEMEWLLPSIIDKYETKPTQILSHLLGHEGQGSILSFLKAKGWANGLSSGPSESQGSFSMFNVSIECTDEGIEQVEAVVGAVYQYLARLRQEGVQEWVYNECRDIAEMNFRFKSKSKPMQYTYSVASQMQLLPAELTLSGASLFHHFSPEDISTFCSALTPDNMLLTVVSKTFEGVTDQEEKWYGTKYRLSDLSAELQTEWGNPSSIDSELQLPVRNAFIPTDFSLRPHPAQGPMVDPVLIHNDGRLLVWFKHDETFKKPKTNLLAQLLTPAVTHSPEAQVLTLLLTEMVSEELNEYAYDASIAGLHFQVSPFRDGIELLVFGYNHKLTELLERVVSTLATPALAPNVFDRMKDKVEKSLRNFSYSQPYQQAMTNTALCTESPRWQVQDRVEALTHVSLQDLEHFANHVLRRAVVEVLVHGNSTASEAFASAEVVASALSVSSPFQGQAKRAMQVRAVELPQGECIYRRPVLNPAEKNSAIEVIYQIGEQDAPGSFGLVARLQLLMHLAKEPCYNELRTKQQLGYIVFSGSFTTCDWVHSARFIVQSEVKDPAGLDECIEEFLVFLRSELVDIKDEDFGTNRQAVVDKLLEKPKNLNEETNRIWQEVQSGRYEFQHAKKQADAVRALVKADVIAFFDRFIAADAPLRRKFSAQTYGSPFPIPEGGSDGADGATGKPLLVEDAAVFKSSRPLMPNRPSPGLGVVELGQTEGGKPGQAEEGVQTSEG